MYPVVAGTIIQIGWMEMNKFTFHLWRKQLELNVLFYLKPENIFLDSRGSSQERFGVKGAGVGYFRCCAEVAQFSCCFVRGNH